MKKIYEITFALLVKLKTLLYEIFLWLVIVSNETLISYSTEYTLISNLNDNISAKQTTNQIRSSKQVYAKGQLMITVCLLR